MSGNQKNIQLIWGVALTIAGIGVFVILPHRMEQIRQLRQVEPDTFDMLFLWFCFGLLGVLLIGGGLKKIHGFFKQPPNDGQGQPNRDDN